MSQGLSGKLAWTEVDQDASRIARLTTRLTEEDGRAADEAIWPESLWDLLDREGAPRWTLPDHFGGESCPRPLLVQRYAQLAGGSLTAVFILSQHDAAVRRLLAALESRSAERWLSAIGRDRAVATVGIS